MDLHILSDPVIDFFEVPQKRVLNKDFWHFLIGFTKTQFKILNLAWWSIGTNNSFVDTHIFI